MMNRLTDRNIILVTRRTRLQDLIVRYNTVEQARFYIEHLGGDFSDYIGEDARYDQSVRTARESLEHAGRVQVLERDFVPNFIFGEQDIVVAVGQDGLVANTLKYLRGQPLIGVNPDPGRWDGVLLPFEAADLRSLLPDVLAGRRPLREVTMAKASLGDGQMLYAVNDLFIGQKTHVSARYRIQVGDRAENQSSSGIIISTGLGSTGWLKSILTGADAISARSRSEGRAAEFPGGQWDMEDLYYSVREPFPSIASGTDLIFGRLTPQSPLQVRSQMAENGVIFSDGVEQDFLVFNAGALATVAPADKKGYLVR